MIKSHKLIGVVIYSGQKYTQAGDPDVYVCKASKSDY